MGELIDNIGNCAQVFRFSRIGGFLQTFLGMLAVSLFTNIEITIVNYVELSKVIVIYGLVMYGGLFGLNNYFDRDRDKLSEITKDRVLPSDRLNAKNVLFLSITLVVLSLLLGIFFLPKLILIQVIFVCTNLIYSIFLKDIDRLFAAVVVHITQSLRFLLGVLIMGGESKQYIGFYILIWIVTVVSATYKIKLVDQKYPSQILTTMRYILAFLGCLTAASLSVKHNNVVLYTYMIAGFVSISNIFKKDSLYTSIFWKK